MWIEKHYKLVAVFLLIVFLSLAVSSIWPGRKSPTCDEVSHHITTGYVYWTKGDFAFGTAAPPLARLMISAPLLLMKIDLPDDRSFWAREDRGQFSYEFMYELNRNIVREIIFYARLMVILTCLLGGIFLFLWSRKKLGGLTALLGLMFYSLSPNVLAHSRMATCDAINMVFVMISVLLFWDFLMLPSYKRVLLSGVCLGLALMAKYSALLLVPLYSVIMAYWFYKRRPKHPDSAACMFLCLVGLAFLVLWAGYGFEFRPFLQNVLRVDAKVEMFRGFVEKFSPFSGAHFADKWENTLFTKPIPLSSYILGVLGVLRHGAEESRTYFVGQWREGGHRLYYAVAYLIKTPIPVTISFFTGIIVAFKTGKNKAFIKYLLLFIAGFFIFASKSKLQLGLRYVLLVYPFIFIIAACGLESLLKRKGYARIIGFIMICWLCISSVLIWPNYLSYFNEIIGGGKNGYKYLRDSNIDWGQDLPSLAKYLEEKNIENVKLLYFGSASPEYYEIDYKEITKDEYKIPNGEVYAISVHYLDSVSWTFEKEPVERIGNSIFIYDFR